MRPFVCFVVVLAVSPVPTPAAGFKPNRAVFFRDCAVLTNFVLSKDKKTAIPAGKTRLLAAITPRIELIFDAWDKRGDTDSRRLAFILATARRESACSDFMCRTHGRTTRSFSVSGEYWLHTGRPRRVRVTFASSGRVGKAGGQRVFFRNGVLYAATARTKRAPADQ